ncbi:MAG: type II CRISPR-associated endonuclease Cas1 [Bacteroidota bacterium]|nr:type II CRISPR-associated endonuclease Cas1 [Bacteroidota bacterium]
MIKRTLYFGNPAYLKTRNEQMVITKADTGEETSVPIEDIGVVILDNQQVTITQALLAKLLENNAAVITCDNTHHPTGLLLNLSGNTLQSAKFRAQINASEPLRKQLWQQTVQCKIENQAGVLERRQVSSKPMYTWAREVKSDDSENHEGRAAAYYWRNLFGEDSKFRRERFGDPPNNMLNYAYAILRACVARSLVGSGLLPTLGIHHRNQYNAYCLADDIIEPYRPWADLLVCEILEDENQGPLWRLDTETKKRLLTLPQMDVVFEGKRSPLLVGLQRTTASLALCFEKKAKRILYPEIPA